MTKDAQGNYTDGNDGLVFVPDPGSDRPDKKDSEKVAGLLELLTSLVVPKFPLNDLLGDLRAAVEAIKTGISKVQNAYAANSLHLPENKELQEVFEKAAGFNIQELKLPDGTFKVDVIKGCVKGPKKDEEHKGSELVIIDLTNEEKASIKFTKTFGPALASIGAVLRRNST